MPIEYGDERDFREVRRASGFWFGAVPKGTKNFLEGAFERLIDFALGAGELASKAAATMAFLPGPTITSSIAEATGLTADQVHALMVGAMPGQLQTGLAMWREAGGNATAILMEFTGETNGVERNDSLLKALTEDQVAIYEGRRLLTSVPAEIAEAMLAGMKRNIRQRMRVR